MEHIHPKKGDIHLGSMVFSEKELRDILKAWLAISLAFAIILSAGTGSLMTSFIISALTVGVGFIFHELGHKILAQKYGAWAEFRAWNQMLILAVIMSFFGFIFAAPGAVMIAGRTIGRSRMGKIAAAGPMMSFAIAIVFLGIMIYFPTGLLNVIGSYGFFINRWLGIFNLIPLAMFDGKKIFQWNKLAYGILVAVGIGLMFVSFGI